MQHADRFVYWECLTFILSIQSRILAGRDIHVNKKLIFQVFHLLGTLFIDKGLGLNACNHSIPREFQGLILWIFAPNPCFLFKKHKSEVNWGAGGRKGFDFFCHLPVSHISISTIGRFTKPSISDWIFRACRIHFLLLFCENGDYNYNFLLSDSSKMTNSTSLCNPCTYFCPAGNPFRTPESPITVSLSFSGFNSL